MASPFTPEFRRTFRGPATCSASRKNVNLRLEVLEDRFLPSVSVHILKDINPGLASSNAGSFTAYNGKVYFSANDGVHGVELWQSNGTAAGTVLLKDLLNPGG